MARISFANRKGAATSAGMLSSINSVWNWARAAMPVPALKPINAEKRLPAQVGQPANSPLAAPILPTNEVLGLCCLPRLFFNLNAETARATLKPNKTDTTVAKMTFSGIIRIKKWSAR